MIPVRAEAGKNINTAVAGNRMLAVLAVFCLAYYATICLAMGKWNSTFAMFWPLAGAGCLTAHLAVRWGPDWLAVAVCCLCSIAFFIFAVVEARICWEMRKKPDRSCRFIIVLGAQVCGEKVTDSLRRRLEEAVRYLVLHPETKAVVSGGRGKGENITEAEAMKKYLIERGISPERILSEEKSASTRENFCYSKQLICHTDKPVGIVTNNFHMYRAVCWARIMGYQNLHTLPAGTHPVLFLNYITREFFGICKLWLLDKGEKNEKHV